MRLLAVALLLAALPVRAADLPAQLNWYERVELSTPVSGVVASVNVQPGQTVPKGALLLSLDPTLFKANLAEAQADATRQDEELADSQKELNRANELYARTVSSTTELDASKLRHAKAAALLNAARARTDKARRLLAESEIHAPYTALILDRQAQPGMVVSAQYQPPALITVARADQILARAGLTAAQAAGIKPGARLEVSAGGKTLAGKVVALRAGADGRYQIDVAIPRGGLLAGMTANIRLP
ncbi:MAG TPA: efflux RND transporter periplasmic adaptor subunit [Parasulfuritortus sp.]